MNYQFRKASTTDLPEIWNILQDAIQRRKDDGSNQWQDGYPNIDVLKKDLVKSAGYILVDNKTIVGYCALLINDEPEYANIEGEWLTNGDFVVFHRVAITKEHLRKGFAKKLLDHIENFALNNKISSIKADTNFDNHAMKHLFNKLGYVYCGKVYFRGSPREAFEKMLS